MSVELPYCRCLLNEAVHVVTAVNIHFVVLSVQALFIVCAV